MAEVLGLSPAEQRGLTMLEFKMAVAYLDDRNERLKGDD
jgi:hypothetical protein